MAGFTLTDFQQIVAKCFEGTDGGELDAASVDSEFGDLGYDSIVVYEIAVRIQDDYGVAIPDEDLDDLKTPADFIAYIGARIPAAS
ncbi:MULTISPECIES: acyl carrier protein [unclassified Streptomyces]|uniref:acyl carrier protein n=1 Tax=Streptomycetaceae TaxID=2062 RepID=UPI002E761A6B|nr:MULTISPECIES: acyl carrier protein [unclassified Streptomyces]MED7950328.1 acyl carrier protein [Streptomyces sp. BE303]MEE1828569.1 acyl carrier protein [Streptomyces sp. BE20]